MSASDPIPQTPRAKLSHDQDEADDIIDGLSSYGDETVSAHKLERHGSKLLDPAELRLLSVNALSQNGHFSPASFRSLSPAPAPVPRRSRIQSYWIAQWNRNKGPFMVAVAQGFAASMNLITRLLEREADGLRPMQILLVRMVLTLIATGMWMWWNKVPDAPFGPRGVRLLLLVRGVAGFIGLYGMWYSLMYLPLAEATVITFLAPNLAGYLSHVFLHERFTRAEQIASFVALGGVVMITRPVSLFSSSSPTSSIGPVVEVVMNATQSVTRAVSAEPEVTIPQRLSAIAVALGGVCGGSVVITVLRHIGKRADPLISVAYFSTWCTIVTSTTLTVAPLINYGQPDLRIELPHSLRQWVMVITIGVLGFTAQYLTTYGLAVEKSNRATAMIYTNMLFAAGFDKWIFGHEMGWLSVAGCGMIVGSALWVAFTKQDESQTPGMRDVEATAAVVGSEAIPMLADFLGEDEDDGGIIGLENIR